MKPNEEKRSRVKCIKIQYLNATNAVWLAHTAAVLARSSFSKLENAIPSYVTAQMPAAVGQTVPSKPKKKIKSRRSAGQNSNIKSHPNRHLIKTNRQMMSRAHAASIILLYISLRATSTKATTTMTKIYNCKSH